MEPLFDVKKFDEDRRKENALAERIHLDLLSGRKTGVCTVEKLAKVLADIVEGKYP